MNTYEIIQQVEMTISHTVCATTAEAANEIATDRTLTACRALARRRRNISFGDLIDDYVPAED